MPHTDNRHTHTFHAVPYVIHKLYSPNNKILGHWGHIKTLIIFILSDLYKRFIGNKYENHRLDTFKNSVLFVDFLTVYRIV